MQFSNETLKESDCIFLFNYTRNILNIKDKKITFEEICLEERKIDKNIINFLFL
jgi:hypothetical protein